MGDTPKTRWTAFVSRDSMDDQQVVEDVIKYEYDKHFLILDKQEGETLVRLFIPMSDVDEWTLDIVKVEE